jgi:hypothetical protein
MSHETANVGRSTSNAQRSIDEIVGQADRLPVHKLASGALALQIKSELLYEFFPFEGFLGLIDNRLERVLVADGKISQDLPIESDAGGFQSFGESAVGYSVGASGSVKPLDPQVTKGPFARFAVAIGPVFAFHGRVLGVTEKFRPASAITFRFFDDAFASGPAGRGVGGSWHFVSPGGSRTPRSAAVVTLSIFPTSPADLVPLRGTRWRDASDVLSGRENRWLAKNDNGFSYRENFSVWP